MMLRTVGEVGVVAVVLVGAMFAVGAISQNNDEVTNTTLKDLPAADQQIARQYRQDLRFKTVFDYPGGGFGGWTSVCDAQGNRLRMHFGVPLKSSTLITSPGAIDEVHLDIDACH